MTHAGTGATPAYGRTEVATDARTLPAPAAALRRPRLGFLGVGWIGRLRLAALAESCAAHVVAVADPSAECLEACRKIAPHAAGERSLGGLLSHDLDGVVIATPSALHAEQAIRALERGVAVFCQKPLARSEAEHRAVMDAARAADRLLGVDLSYRFTRAAEAVRSAATDGSLGRVYAAELVFHNAYGPERPWFYRRSEAGGGCLMDLGTHLLDLLFWVTGEGAVRDARGTLLHGGEPLASGDDVEDFAAAEVVTAGGVLARLACSWRLPAGQDAVISFELFGTAGGVRLRNVGGSFYDFVAERTIGTRCETLVKPPDAWGGRALVAWANALARSPRYDPTIESLLVTARVLDALYGR